MYWPKKLTASLIALMMAIPSGVTKVLAEEVVEEPVEDEVVEVVEEEVAEEEVVEIEEEAVEVEEAAEIEVVEDEARVGERHHRAHPLGDLLCREALRGKLGSKGEMIKTIWGMGYKFEA